MAIEWNINEVPIVQNNTTSVSRAGASTHNQKAGQEIGQMGGPPSFALTLPMEAATVFPQASHYIFRTSIDLR